MTAGENTYFPRRAHLFEQVSDMIAERISRGEWKPGEMLPNEVELSQRFQVSQGTMRRALRILTESGVLVRQQGRGSFVAEFSSEQMSVMHRFVRLEADPGISTAQIATSAELVKFEKEPAPLEVCRALRIPAGESAIHAVRLLKAGGELITWDEIWANAEDFKALSADNIMHHKEKVLYAFYQNVCGVTITSVSETAKACLLDTEICRRFGLAEPLPVIEIRRIAFTLGNRPVEYRVQRSITEHYHYRIS